MSRRTLLTGLLVLLLAAPAAVAQHRMRGSLPEVDFHVDSKDGSFTIPFKLINNHLIIPVSIGETIFDVILDTGMPVSGLMLYGTDEVDALDLAYNPMEVRVAGAGGKGGTKAARLAQGATVRIENATMSKTTVIVMPPLEALALYHDGVIGASLFNNFVVSIDYDKSVVHLYDPEKYVAPENAAVLPVTLGKQRRIPFVDLTVTPPGGTPVALNVVVDLGASHAISLNADTTGALSVPEGAITTVIGHGVGGEVNGQVARIAALELAGFELEGVVATFPVKEHQHPGSSDSRNGNLGSGILKRFNVTFDYANERMLLVPNESFGAPFEWDMSGMRLWPEDGGLKVAQVLADSPAAEAGLAVDDVVTQVNGKPASPKTLVELRELMREDGAEIEITATREGKPIEVKLTLRRMV